MSRVSPFRRGVLVGAALVALATTATVTWAAGTVLALAFAEDFDEEED